MHFLISCSCIFFFLLFWTYFQFIWVAIVSGRTTKCGSSVKCLLLNEQEIYFLKILFGNCPITIISRSIVLVCLKSPCILYSYYIAANFSANIYICWSVPARNLYLPHFYFKFEMHMLSYTSYLLFCLFSECE